MNARTDILARLRDTLDRQQGRADREAAVARRLQNPPLAQIPKRGQTSGAQLRDTFIEEARHADAQVHRLAGVRDIPAAVRLALDNAHINALKITPHPTLKALDWAGMDVQFGPGLGGDHLGLSVAYAGVAETGTLVMVSGPTSPVTLNFLPDVHMVVILERDLVANYEAVWQRLRDAAPPGAGFLPRTVNWITGPSRTADIEQTLLLGAHGPRKLIILLIDG